MHLFSPTGFLDDSWWHRSYWVYGRSFAQGAGGWPLAGRFAPGGRLLVFDDTLVYGYGRRPDLYKWTAPLEYHFFASQKQPKDVVEKPVVRAAQKRTPEQAAKTAQTKANPAAQKKLTALAEANKHQIQYEWSEPLPLYVRAMLLSGKTLFLAGPAHVVDEEEAFERSDNPRNSRPACANKPRSLPGARALRCGSYRPATVRSWPSTSSTRCPCSTAWPPRASSFTWSPATAACCALPQGSEAPRIIAPHPSCHNGAKGEGFFCAAGRGRCGDQLNPCAAPTNRLRCDLEPPDRVIGGLFLFHVGGHCRPRKRGTPRQGACSTI